MNLWFALGKPGKNQIVHLELDNLLCSSVLSGYLPIAGVMAEPIARGQPWGELAPTWAGWAYRRRIRPNYRRLAATSA